MKNKEYYEDDIFNITMKEMDDSLGDIQKIVEIVTSKKIGAFSVNKNTRKICECTNSNCDICLFKDEELSCSFIRNEWANSEHIENEHIEPFTLTLLEKNILENLDKEFNWIARYYNEIYVYEERPKRTNGCWFSPYGCSKIPLSQLFKFVKKDDEEPYNIKKILKNCEVINDDLG